MILFLTILHRVSRAGFLLEVGAETDTQKTILSSHIDDCALIVLNSAYARCYFC